MIMFHTLEQSPCVKHLRFFMTESSGHFYKNMTMVEEIILAQNPAIKAKWIEIRFHCVWKNTLIT